MYTSSPEDDNSSPDIRNSPSSTQRTKPGSYGKACDTCRKKKARCNFEKPTCGYCSAFKHKCSYTAAAACANRRNAKKLSIETKRQQRPALPSRKSTGGSFKQPYTADATSPSGYLTPVTPHERRLIHSAGPSYHHSRQEMLGSPIPTSRSSVYSPDSTSPTVSLSPINGHGGPRYQQQQVRPYGQSSNGYLPDTRAMVQKDDTSQRTANYMAQMSFMEHQGKEHQTQAQTHLMEPSASEPSHSFAQQEMHHSEQVQRVVSPTNHASMTHFHSQYAGYEYHHRPDLDNNVQQDPRQQMQQEWNPRRQSVPLTTNEQRTMYRYHEVDGQNGYTLR